MENNVVLDSHFNTGMIMDNVGAEMESPQEVVNNVVSNQNIDYSQFIPRKPKQMVREYKIGRNEPCPCGSGNKYKRCCLSTGKYEKLIVKE
jgi:uncharacterized protein YecA (UPF0149 family)